MIPPELVDFLDDWPIALLVVFLAAPFLVFLGGIVQAFIVRRGPVSTKVGEREAKTHEFSAIVTGFEALLTKQKIELDQLGSRVARLEGHQDRLIQHIGILERMIPIPPGPPPRPTLYKVIQQN